MAPATGQDAEVAIFKIHLLGNTHSNYLDQELTPCAGNGIQTCFPKLQAQGTEKDTCNSWTASPQRQPQS